MVLTKPAKLPLPESFASLCGYIATLRQGLGLLAEAIDAKADVPTRMSVTLPTSGWELDQTEGIYKCSVTVTGLTVNHVPTVILTQAGVEAASAAGVYNWTESTAGAVVFRSASVPASALTGQMVISLSQQ